MVCEKPDAARRVAEALSGGSPGSYTVNGTIVFRFVRGTEEFVVCSAQGHLYGVSDPFKERTVYPVFDVEWYPSDLLGERSSGAGRKVAAIRNLSAGATRFVNACDFDAEGETIGFNILKYACGGKEVGALRAKFSTLAPDELVRAFREARPQSGQWLALAGRARHLVDFVWGINLSRVLSQAARVPGRRYATVSIGRVQGPTLGFLVQREREIRGFVPTPYWKVSGVFEKEGGGFVAYYSVQKVETRGEAERVRDDCTGKEGLVSEAKKSVVQVGPPATFNVGDLQKEAFRVLGLSPARTLQIAERLYLGALISYPRTGSQKLPPSIGYRAILEGIGRMAEYSGLAPEVLRGTLRPVQGTREDPAHPAIYPTGGKPRGELGRQEGDIFDLIVRRFLSAFGPAARKEIVRIRISVGRDAFVTEGSRVTFPGWTRFYGRYYWSRESEVPDVAEGDRVNVAEIRVEDKFEQHPPRYSQGSLLEKMESERIGTKATRAETIATIASRGYVQGDATEVTDLGFSVVETMERYSPAIVTTELTRDVEQQLERIEGGNEAGKALVRQTVRLIAEQLQELTDREEEVGRGLVASIETRRPKFLVLGGCPVCKTGQLRLVKSRKTQKRFVGCSNYASGCRASAPLPQRGTIRPTSKPCRHCSWPIVYVLGGRYPWRLCVNPRCPAKGARRA